MKYGKLIVLGLVIVGIALVLSRYGAEGPVVRPGPPEGPFPRNPPYIVDVKEVKLFISKKEVRVGEPVDVSVQVVLKSKALDDGVVGVLIMGEVDGRIVKLADVNVPVRKGSMGGALPIRVVFNREGRYVVWAKVMFSGVRSKGVIIDVRK